MLGLKGASAARFPRRRLVNLGVVLAVISTVVGLAVTRSGVPASAMRLLTGDAWLENASAGTVSHVNGYSGETDAQATVGKAGDPFQVVQRPGGAFVLDLRTGRLSRLDDSGLNVTTSATEPTPAKALQVITGTNATWILDKSSGVLQQVNPTTLKPLGHQVALGGRTGTGVVDSSGSIWVPLLSGAGVDQVNPGGALSHHAFGRAGDAIELADTSGGVWAVDTHAKTVASLSTPTDHAVSLPALTKALIVGASSSSPDLVLVSGDQVLNVDTTQPSLSSLALPAAAASVTQVAVSSGQAYLLDPQTHRLDTVNLSPMGIAASTPVPAGANQLVDKDQLVFVNSTSAPQALVVNPDGAVTNVTKYTPGVPPPPNNQTQTTVPTSNPTPNTTPSQSSTAPQQTAPPAPVPEGTTPPVAPPTTTPQPTPPARGGLPPAAPPTTAPAPTVPLPTSPPPTAPPTTVPAPPTTAAPTVPGAPTGVNFTASKGQITWTWSAPASDGGSPLTGYKVTGPNVNGTATSPTYTINGLGNGVNECAQVQAVNAVGGSPFSGQVCATTPSPPAAVSNLSITPGDSKLTISWGAASGATSYQVTGAGPAQTTTATSLTVGVPAWTSLTVQVTPVNSVGAGPVANQPGTAWMRTGTVTCFDSQSGDRGVENDCSNAGPGLAWSIEASNINWINPQGHLDAQGDIPGMNLKWLCSTYETAGVSGDTYAFGDSSSKTSCEKALPNSQDPTQPHVIAAVSATKLDANSQQICEYKGTTTGTSTTNGKKNVYTTEELTICGSGVPADLSGATQVTSFWT